MLDYIKVHLYSYNIYNVVIQVQFFFRWDFVKYEKTSKVITAYN